MHAVVEDQPDPRERWRFFFSGVWHTEFSGWLLAGAPSTTYQVFRGNQQSVCWIPSVYWYWQFILRQRVPRPINITAEIYTCAIIHSWIQHKTLDSGSSAVVVVVSVVFSAATAGSTTNYFNCVVPV